MTIEELHESLPDELRVTPERIPPDVAEAIAYLGECNDLRDAGTAEADLPTIEKWRSGRG